MAWSDLYLKKTAERPVEDGLQGESLETSWETGPVNQMREG